MFHKQFNLKKSDLYYYRSHYDEREAWLQLVVKEGDIYYRIISWKGSGYQKDRFLALFLTLVKEMEKFKTGKDIDPSESLLRREIIANDEVELMNPFTERYEIMVMNMNV